MAEMAVTQKPPVLLRQENQMQATGSEDAAGEVVPEEAVKKDVADKEDAVTALHTYYQSGTSSKKWRILAQY